LNQEAGNAPRQSWSGSWNVPEAAPVRVWDLTTGREAPTFTNHTGFVTGLADSADGRRLASASEDETVRVWEAATGRKVFTLRGHVGHGKVARLGETAY
jgi:WD40 repeat protein